MSFFGATAFSVTKLNVCTFSITTL